MGWAPTFYQSHNETDHQDSKTFGRVRDEDERTEGLDYQSLGGLWFGLDGLVAGRPPGSQTL